MSVKVLVLDNCSFAGYETWDDFTKANARKSYHKMDDGQWDIDFVEKKANVIIVGHEDGQAIYVKQ